MQVNAVFDVANDGTFKFYNNGELHEGTWIVYFIEDELHTNVAFDETGMTADDWNFDWKTEILPNNVMTFTNPTISFTLTQECDEENYCTELIFSECETIDGSGISEFIFEDYIPCILQIEDLEELATDDTIAFYETEMDANNETNPLSQSSYQNILPEQTIYVRVYYAATGEIFIIPITIVGIESIKWIGDQNGLDQEPAPHHTSNILSEDPNFQAPFSHPELKSYSVFPGGRYDSNDFTSYKTPRNTVSVKLKFTIPPIEKINIHVRSFDIDDPYTDPAI